MATAEAALAALESIARDMRLLVAHFGIGQNGASQQAAGPLGVVASDTDLDGQYGDPEVKAKDPRDWTGEPMRGRLFSECPPEYLDLVAERLDYFIEQATEQMNDNPTPDELAELKKKMKYNKKDAARARGWAARLRAGWQQPPEEPSTDTGAGFAASSAPLTDDDIPF